MDARVLEPLDRPRLEPRRHRPRTGPAGGPDLGADGALFWGPRPATYAYAVEDRPCVDLAGTLVGSHVYRAGGALQTWRLIRLAQPNRLRSVCTGIYPDGWSGAGDSAYFRFSNGHGWLRIVVSRKDWGGPPDPSPVHLLVGKLVINANRQPILGSITKQVDLTIDSRETQTRWLQTALPRFAVHVVVDKKFVPHAVDPHLSDTRTLGAQITYTFSPTKPAGCP